MRDGWSMTATGTAAIRSPAHCSDQAQIKMDGREFLLHCCTLLARHCYYHQKSSALKMK